LGGPIVVGRASSPVLEKHGGVIAAVVAVVTPEHLVAAVLVLVAAVLVLVATLLVAVIAVLVAVVTAVVTVVAALLTIATAVVAVATALLAVVTALLAAGWGAGYWDVWAVPYHLFRFLVLTCFLIGSRMVLVMSENANTNWPRGRE
jgi:hypothetical protein